MNAPANRKFLGIDYGSRNVGIAVSDEDGKLAFPRCNLQNDKIMLEKIAKIISEEKAAEIVVGESINYKGEDNPIMKDILIFIKKLEKKFSLPIHLEPEFLTSAEARRLQKENEKSDSSAAAIILQSYLDKRRQKA
jgi:putative holliday junction resolvase